MKKNIMIACPNIKNELMAVIDECGANFPILFAPEETHLSPERLNSYLQSIINNITNVDYILLPMGLCGNGTLGLVSNCASLVLPKCGDCIDLILSDKDFCFERPKYTYFLTEGWLEKKASIDTDFKNMIDRYGLTKSKVIVEMIYKHYKYFSFIDTGCYCVESAKERIKPIADMADMTINTLCGRLGMLKKMAALELDDNFVITAPGVSVMQEHFQK